MIPPKVFESDKQIPSNTNNKIQRKGQEAINDLQNRNNKKTSNKGISAKTSSKNDYTLNPQEVTFNNTTNREFEIED